jgi:hypothetical protein
MLEKIVLLNSYTKIARKITFKYRVFTECPIPCGVVQNMNNANKLAFNRLPENQNPSNSKLREQIYILDTFIQET